MHTMGPDHQMQLLNDQAPETIDYTEVFYDARNEHG